MGPGAASASVQAVVDRVQAAGGEAFVSRGVERTIVGLVGDVTHFATLQLEALPGVAQVLRISRPYKLVSREHHPERSVVEVGGVPIGPGIVTLIAGPCAVETPEQTLEAATMAKEAGASLLRGGAYKPRTSPYAFQGLGVRGLEILAETREATGLPVVTEVVDAADVPVVAEHADMLQVGTRNMQNFALLQAVGAAGKPVLLKRGLTATYDEWLMAAEYIAQRGNLAVVLCERGVRSFEPALRNMLDVSAVPVVQSLSHLPVVVDPSHSGGKKELVVPLARAGLAAGADGLIVDVHPEAGDGAVRRAAGAAGRRARRAGRRLPGPPARAGPPTRARRRPGDACRPSAPCSRTSGSSSKPCSSRSPARSCGASSRPSARFTSISHPVTALTSTCPDPISRRAPRPRRSSSAAHHSSTCVSSSRFTAARHPRPPSPRRSAGRRSPRRAAPGRASSPAGVRAAAGRRGPGARSAVRCGR